MSEVRYHQLRGNEIVEQAKRLGAYIEQRSFAKKALHVATVAVSIGSLAALKYAPETEPAIICTPECIIGPEIRTPTPKTRPTRGPALIPRVEPEPSTAKETVLTKELEAEHARERLKTIFRQNIAPQLTGHELKLIDVIEEGDAHFIGLLMTSESDDSFASMFYLQSKAGLASDEVEVYYGYGGELTDVLAWINVEKNPDNVSTTTLLSGELWRRLSHAEGPLQMPQSFNPNEQLDIDTALAYIVDTRRVTSTSFYQHHPRR
jgi:hypothetical protein